jgi:hypothetical protein
MSVLDLLGAIDIRDQLPHADWRVGLRAATTSLTWHYNGPAVPDSRQHGGGLIAQLRADAQYQMRAGWGGTKNGAPGLMYHFVVDALGTIYQTADLFDILWHCAHADGNSRGLALHFPLGGTQAPSSAQLFAAEKATHLLCQAFSIPLNRVLGHREWKHATECPGEHLMADLMRYRAGAAPYRQPTIPPPGIRLWQINPLYTDPVRVHTAPRLDSPVAGRLKPGTVVYVDVVKNSEVRDAAHPRFVHMARIANEQADLGFLAEDCGVWL